jgi:two-component sensor histidine kinase
LQALAQAHEHVRPYGPASGPETEPQKVHGLLRLLLAPYLSEGRERVQITGSDVPLGPESATALALCLHEQATNAVKYGALSVEGGKILVKCAQDQEEFRLTWQEAGGPAVKGPPSRRGFGTVLAARSIENQLGGELAHSWEPAGLIMTLKVPVETLQR